ncbi:energy transducer TonB [Candidatus Nitrosacidococcus tergens]|uniref:Putative TonB family protein n=1 Tax=Candidatus Nitrosacidococcus tergens TaxID=553981 RepID=A0A7G1Q7W7_9GAMM|nr:energy transducer TonB [Candidatus Nitrosacidococcus tergens]CAB1274642.1 putative TonB family protein [Candidatus Nitrosacidococcus tergens]
MFMELIALLYRYPLRVGVVISLLIHVAIVLNLKQNSEYPIELKKNPSPMINLTLITPIKKEQSPSSTPKIAPKKQKVQPVPAYKKKTPNTPLTKPLSKKNTLSSPKKILPKSSTPDTHSQKNISHSSDSAIKSSTSQEEIDSKIEIKSKLIRGTVPSSENLVAHLDQHIIDERHTDGLRRRYISSSTKLYAATSYLDSWRKKVERVGRLSYPEEAKRQNLSGQLVLSVDLNPNGTVANITIRKSSGHKVLDKAAVQIVHLAAPFAKVPKSLLEGYDILTITRTWTFASAKYFSSN